LCSGRLRAGCLCSRHMRAEVWSEEPDSGSALPSEDLCSAVLCAGLRCPVVLWWRGGCTRCRTRGTGPAGAHPRGCSAGPGRSCGSCRSAGPGRSRGSEGSGSPGAEDLILRDPLELYYDCFVR